MAASVASPSAGPLLTGGGGAVGGGSGGGGDSQRVVSRGSASRVTARKVEAEAAVEPGEG